MNKHDANTFDMIQRAATGNVEIMGRIAFADIESHLQAATVLVNTSVSEGFPNSFLQAGKFGKPVVSLQVDPGEMLSRFGCGICARGDLITKDPGLCAAIPPCRGAMS